MKQIQYQREQNLDSAEFIDCLVRSTLAARRPVDQPETIEGMLRNANVIVTARTETGLLIGVSRAITDFYYCTYLSDLAVDQAWQGQGIGRTLIEQTHEIAGLSTMLLLLSAPAAESYYPHIGMTPHKSAWYVPRK
jgi:GNAT superfamily N-acetyltransferase